MAANIELGKIWNDRNQVLFETSMCWFVMQFLSKCISGDFWNLPCTNLLDFLQTQQISKRKRKKKQESLQSAPYHLKDGDIIGVKVNQPCFNCGTRIRFRHCALCSILISSWFSCILLCLYESTGMWISTVCCVERKLVATSALSSPALNQPDGSFMLFPLDIGAATFCSVLEHYPEECESFLLP